MSSNGGFKHDLFAQFARMGKALSSGNWLEMLEFLAQGEQSVEALASVAGMSVGSTFSSCDREAWWLHVRNLSAYATRWPVTTWSHF